MRAKEDQGACSSQDRGPMRTEVEGETPGDVQMVSSGIQQTSDQHVCMCVCVHDCKPPEAWVGGILKEAPNKARQCPFHKPG